MTCTRCVAKTKGGTQCKNKTCKQFPYCWVHLKANDKLQIKKSTIEGAGEGLFYVGKNDLPPNKKVTLYSSKKAVSTPIEGDYVLQVGKKYIDGEDKSNFVGRYINSPAGTKRLPNVRFSKGYKITKVQGRETVPIISTKKIKPNSELLLSYGKSYKFGDKVKGKSKKK